MCIRSPAPTIPDRSIRRRPRLLHLLDLRSFFSITSYTSIIAYNGLITAAAVTVGSVFLFLFFFPSSNVRFTFVGVSNVGNKLREK